MGTQILPGDSWGEIIKHLDLSSQLNLSWVNRMFRDLCMRRGRNIYINFGSRRILGVKEGLIDTSNRSRQTFDWEDYCIMADDVFGTNFCIVHTAHEDGGVCESFRVGDCCENIVLHKVKQIMDGEKLVVIFKSGVRKCIFYFKPFKSNHYGWILDGYRVY